MGAFFGVAQDSLRKRHIYIACAGKLQTSCYLDREMSNVDHIRAAACVFVALSLGACAGSGDRYPDLNLRDFERVQGSFTSAAGTTVPREPTSLAASTLSELEATLEAASARHQRFLSQANTARPIVASASGLGIEDNRWPIAQIEIADLESQNGELMSLLADLDALYSDATFEFGDRERIDRIREQVTEFHATERQVISELVTLLAGSRQP
ncbi:hypothetical protein BPTFM16_00398 [Altererythrobacter insulae]|nr:hypothetical protein BPTFM16_00398 [Altererythrobacter insulae]